MYCNKIQAAELGFQVETVRAGSEPHWGGRGACDTQRVKMQLRTGPGGPEGSQSHVLGDSTGWEESVKDRAAFTERNTHSME